MNDPIEASYAECRRYTRRAATNFYLSFLLLPRAKRNAMCALHAFLRQTDNLGDDDAPSDVRRVRLEAWRQTLDRALQGRFESPLLPALIDTLRRFQIPSAYLYTLLDGVLADQQAQTFETWEELTAYCYQVAGVVGLSCLHIWNEQEPSAELQTLAIACGQAFQLTNILRDLREDALAGRVYLPQADLRQFNVQCDDWVASRSDDRFRALMRFEIDRAEQLYEQAAAIAASLKQDGRRSFGAMFGIYRQLLREIDLRTDEVLVRRIRVPQWRKLSIAAQSVWDAWSTLPWRSL